MIIGAMGWTFTASLNPNVRQELALRNVWFKEFYASKFYASSPCGHYFVKTGLCKSAFYTYSFGKLLFHLPVFCVFSVCSVFWIWCHLSRLKVNTNAYHYMLDLKIIPWKFSIFKLRILELFTRENCFS